MPNIGLSFWKLAESGNSVAIFFIFFLCSQTTGNMLKQVNYLF
jgi:uncharacterized membrane protein (DUF106 family)